MEKAKKSAVRRRHQIVYLLVTLVGVSILLLAGSVSPRFFFNETDSVPRGIYAWQVTKKLSYADVVMFYPPRHFHDLAVERGYARAGSPFLKIVVGKAGDSFCVGPDGLVVNGVHHGAVAVADSHGRPLPKELGCQTIGDESYAVTGIHPLSFDSRYFGLIGDSDILGVAKPLWLLRPQDHR